MTVVKIGFLENPVHPVIGLQCLEDELAPRL